MSEKEMQRSRIVRYYPCECGLGFGEEGYKCGFCGKRFKATSQYIETNREITNWGLWLLRYLPKDIKRKRFTIWSDGRLIFALYGAFKSLLFLAHSPDGSVMRLYDEDIARRDGDEVVLLRSIAIGEELRFPILQSVAPSQNARRTHED